jgi:uncharacterized Zn-binding protein involved in type VI secretion
VPDAAVLFSPTSHPGLITGPCEPTVRIRGFAAAAVGDQHACLFPIPPGHVPNVIASGSKKVRIRGRFAARKGDPTACGARIEAGVPTVKIG